MPYKEDEGRNPDGTSRPPSTNYGSTYYPNTGVTVPTWGSSGGNTLTYIIYTDDYIPAVIRNFNGGVGDDSWVGGMGRDTINGGAGNDRLSGALGNDILNGGLGNDILSGGGGADTLNGGKGDDLYVVDHGGDRVVEKANEGLDTVQSRATYTLSANVENLLLTGTGAINGSGNALDNLIAGNSGNNTLNGGAGNDTLLGKAGNDVLNGGAGNDLLNGGIGDDILNGGADADMLIGGDGNDTLNGGTGADVMAGGTGNDLYMVDNVDDMVTEAANAGIDTVQSTISYTLGANIEKLILGGASTLKGTGNALNNTITGNGASNTLDGGLGADTLIGGLGNDTYIVDNLGDTVVELADQGVDTVQSSVSYSLSANVENLTLTGTAASNGTGNALNNTITGNGANNILNGGAGADRLVGGLGNDTYVLGRGYGIDTIVENDSTAGNSDTVQFGAGVHADQLWMRMVNKNLEVSIIGTEDKFVLTNWYAGSQYRVEQFKTSDGLALQERQVQNLVQAMAAFAPPPAGETTLSASYQAALAPVLAANWH